MSRYRGPRVRTMRALGVDLPGLSTKTTNRRPYPPGQHGQGRRKLSEYGIRLMEKQKIRFNYGLTEKQLRRLVQEAKRSRMRSGHKLIELVERRLDNVVFRAGLARTIPGARQLVNHGHVTVDGKRVSIPSFRLDVGQKVGLRERSRNLSPVAAATGEPARIDTPWLDVDREKKEISVKVLPTIDTVPFDLDVQLVIEFYS
ncbi:MAG: 30S ribosomal protein S4 [Myxococcota bacterium]